MLQKSIFEYTDYRHYLSDYYQYQKETRKGFSYRYFLNKVGIKSPSFMKDVIEGKKNLSSVGIKKFSKALELSKRESEYFNNLVLFNQAKTSKKRQHYFLKLSGFQKRAEIHKVRKDKFEYFANWYNLAIREYIHSHKFYDNYEEMADAIEPKITVSQAKKAIALLSKLGLITLGDDGYYKVKDPLITFDPDLENIAAHNLHKSMQEISARALDTVPKEERYFRTFIGSFSEKAFQKIRLELDNARKKIIDIIKEDGDNDKKVYHMGMQLYKMEKNKKKRVKK